LPLSTGECIERFGGLYSTVTIDADELVTVIVAAARPLDYPERT
jgi:hypothetical protein